MLVEVFKNGTVTKEYHWAAVLENAMVTVKDLPKDYDPASKVRAACK